MRLLVALALAALPATALAQGLPPPQQAQCYLPGPPQGAGQTKAYLDMGMTQTFRIDASHQDNEVMAAFTGVYYGEAMSPEGNAVTRVYYSFEPNGLFQYQSQTCGAYQCSDGYGAGQWVGLRADNGMIRVIFNWSDLNIESTCAGATGVLQGNVFQKTDGTIWQVVQKYQANGMPVDPGMNPGRLDLDNAVPPPLPQQ
jgi:hypothetical protein